jgi:hypothetical protein
MPQVLAKACGGVHKVPDILGGGLDTQRARTEWLAKMDEVFADAAAAAAAKVCVFLCWWCANPCYASVAWQLSEGQVVTAGSPVACKTWRMGWWKPSTGVSIALCCST